jgi:hypothetical protein
MKNDILTILTSVPDAEIVARVKTLVARDRETTAEIVALAELDTRDVHLREGYQSLFVYCRDALGFSAWEAYNRIEVARAVRRFPVILELLADGSVHLTAVRRLAPHLTLANHLEVLECARGKTKAEVEEIVARLAPRPDVPASVRRLPTPEPARVPQSDPMAIGGSEPTSETQRPGAALTGPGAPAPSPVIDRAGGEQASSADPGSLKDSTIERRGTGTAVAAVAPLSPDRYRLQLTINGETLERLRLAKDMLGHALPSGDDAAIIDRALRALIAELARKKFAQTRAPRRAAASTAPAESPSDGVRKQATRHVSAAVKRAVWIRDLGRCAFVGASGHRCNERRFVEFHHIDPYALGGEATVDGIQLRCRHHNDYEGRIYFGRRRRGRELVPEQVRLSVARSTPESDPAPDRMEGRPCEAARTVPSSVSS